MRSRITDTKWDIVIIDNSLPQLSALEAIKIIQEQKINIPMICVSGTEMFDIKDKCIAAGAEAFILKDDSKKFAKTIDDVLQKYFG